MTRQILLVQLKRAREIGDRAAEIMLLARIKKEAATDTAANPSGRPERPTTLSERMAGWSELEKRWAFGDR